MITFPSACLFVGEVSIGIFGKESIDLAAFKRVARSGFEHAQMSVNEGECPRSKVARRLPLSSK